MIGLTETLIFISVYILLVYGRRVLVALQRWRKVRLAALKVGTTKSHWLLGHYIEYKDPKKTFALQQKSMEIVPKVLRRRLGLFNYSITTYWPSIVAKILSTNEPKAESTYKLLRPFIGDGLLVSTGRKWKRNRTLLNPLFHSQMLKEYLRVFNETTSVLENIWEEKPSWNVHESVTMMALDTILQCATSVKSNCQIEKNLPYVEAVNDLRILFVDRATNPLLKNDFIFQLSSYGKKQAKVLDFLHSYSSQMIQNRKASLQERRDESKEKDFLSVLLLTKDENGKGLTDEEIRNEVNTFLFAGHDTTSTGISCSLYHLARNQKAQDKCREEIWATLINDKGIAWEDLNKFTYLTMCIKESLRLCPPAYLIRRSLTQSLTFSKDFGQDQYNTSSESLSDCTQTFPPGTEMDVNISNLHKNPHLWDNPDEYNPDRFTSENVSKRQPFTYIPFSSGPRNCIGQNFAMILMKVTLARLLATYKFTVDKQFPKPVMIPRITLKPSNGIHLILHKIKKNDATVPHK